MHIVPVDELSQNVGRKRLKKKAEIIESVLASLETHNINELSLNKLARQLGFSPAALYRYFPSWGALLSEVLVHILEHINHLCDENLRLENERLDKDLTSKQLSKSQRIILDLHILAQSFYQFSEIKPGQFTLISSLLGDTRTLVSEEDASMAVKDALMLFAKLGTLIEDGVANKTFSQQDIVARTMTFWAGLQGILQTKKLARFIQPKPNYQTLSHDFIGALLLSWGARQSDITFAREQLRPL